MGEKLKAIIVDDEESSRRTLNNYLMKYCPQVAVISQASSIKEAKKGIETLHPDLVFLDIEMPYGSAFDLLESLDSINFEVIFVTAYESYAIRALNLSAAYYLLKPIDIDELIKAVAKIESHKNHDQQPPHARITIDNHTTTNLANKKVVLPQSNGFDVVGILEIIRAEANDNYTNIYLTNGKKYLISKTLKHFDEMLTEYNFLRIHKSHLVNLFHITKYIKGNVGQVKLSDESFVDVAASRKKELFARLKQ